MYVCMHVCMYVCMHVCMYARMYVCMYVCMYVYLGYHPVVCRLQANFEWDAPPRLRFVSPCAPKLKILTERCSCSDPKKHTSPFHVCTTVSTSSNMKVFESFIHQTRFVSFIFAVFSIVSSRFSEKLYFFPHMFLHTICVSSLLPVLVSTLFFQKRISSSRISQLLLVLPHVFFMIDG